MTTRVLVDVRLDLAKLDDLLSIPGIVVEVLPFSDEPRELPTATVHDVEILFCTFPPKNCAEMKALRWMQIASSGYSQLFGLDLTERGVRVTNARGCFDVPIAEWNVAMMVNLVRGLPQMMRNQNAKVWDRSAQFQREVRGLTVGIWGYGGLGRETARLAKSTGMKVQAMTRTGVRAAHDVYRVAGTGDPDGALPDKVFVAGEEEEFLRGLDFLILAMPLTRATEGMIGERELSALPSHAFLLNPARGAIVQEQALLKALDKGWIQGAALDTHYHYPMPPQHALWNYPNVIFTPHIAGSSLNPRFTERIWDIFTGNVRRYCMGQSLMNELSPSMLRGD